MHRRFHFALVVLLLATGIARAQGEQARIGVFDPEAVWRLSEVGKKYNQDLSDARDKLQAEIDKKSEEVENLKTKLRQQQHSLSDEKQQQMQKDIQNRMIELNRMNDDATREMKQQLADVQGRFQQMLIDTLEAFGKEKNFTLIFNTAVTDYFAPQTDITQDLIAKFNEMHKAAQPAAGKTPAPKKTP
jgi:Skp family chaperone for outer membrane proteins